MNAADQLASRKRAGQAMRAQDRAAVLNAGFDAHPVKPIDPDELIRTLRG